MSQTGVENHPALKVFVDTAVKNLSGRTRDLQREISQAEELVKGTFKKLVAAETKRFAASKRREERVALLATELEKLSKLPETKEFELSTDGEPTILVSTKPIEGFLPRDDGESDEIILGEFELLIHLSGTYPGLLVRNKTRNVHGAPAPSVGADGQIISTNFQLALPVLLGEQKYALLVQRACQVLRQVPDETPRQILEAWRNTRRRRA